MMFPGFSWTYLEDPRTLRDHAAYWWYYYRDMPDQKIQYDFNELMIERLLFAIAVLLAQWMLCEKDTAAQKRIGSIMVGVLVVVASRVVPWYHAKDTAWLKDVRHCGEDLPPLMVGNVRKMPPEWHSAWREINAFFDMTFQHGPGDWEFEREFDYLDTSPFFRYQRMHMQDVPLPFNGLWAKRAKFVEKFMSLGNDVGLSAERWTYQFLLFAQSMVNKIFPKVILAKPQPSPAMYGCWQFGGGIRAKTIQECNLEIFKPLHQLGKQGKELGDQLSVFMYPPGFGIRWHSDYFTFYQKEYPYRTWLTFTRPVSFKTRRGKGAFVRYHSSKTNGGAAVPAQNGQVIAFCSCQRADDIVWHNVYSKSEVRISVGFGLSTEAVQQLYNKSALRAVREQ
mmetsp:Transcript_139583/g.253930  ORF Transcript_139583/g.253930 Transcript_139583/m.253930 type:complete len:394 (+) Transcript_139583:3-1184(+)